jgi:hypothetical protein
VKRVDASSGYFEYFLSEDSVIVMNRVVNGIDGEGGSCFKQKQLRETTSSTVDLLVD